MPEALAILGAIATLAAVWLYVWLRLRLRVERVRDEELHRLENGHG